MLLIASKAQSAIQDSNSITWNMQGSCSSDSSTSHNKWTVVRSYLQYDFIALQEAGPLNGLPGSISIPFPNVDNPDRVTDILSVRQWNIGSSSRPTSTTYIYFLQTDTGANRCNIAIVTPHLADEVILLYRNPPHRPILGLRIGNDYVFNIHAASMGPHNNNAPELIHRVYDYMLTRSSDSWIVMGDFNRSPESLMNSLRIVRPLVANSIMTVNQDHSTQRSGGNLDYAVVPNNNNGLTARRGLTHSPSDHQQVFFLNPNSMCHF